MINANDASNLLVFVDRALQAECGGLQEARVAAQLQVKLSNIIKMTKQSQTEDTSEDGEDTT